MAYLRAVWPLLASLALQQLELGFATASGSIHSSEGNTCLNDGDEAHPNSRCIVGNSLLQRVAHSSRVRLGAAAKYSQNGQDEWLRDVYGKDYKGFYLDIGAHDGVIISNTQALDENGWQGICVEPLPKNFEKRTCRLFKAVLTNVTGSQVVFNDCTLRGSDGGDGGLSGIKGVGQYAESEKVKNCKPVRFKTTRVDEFLASIKDLPRVIDYLSLDVEGSEAMILSHFPWDKHCIRAATIERPSEEVNKLMLARGCELAAYLGEDFAYRCHCQNH